MRRKSILADEVSALLLEAERIDKDEDKKFGKNRRGDELPEELRRRESRLAKIREASRQLSGQQEARQRAREHTEAAARERGDDEDTVAAKGAAAARLPHQNQGPA